MNLNTKTCFQQVSSGQKDVVAEGSTVLKALLFKRTSPTDY